MLFMNMCTTIRMPRFRERSLRKSRHLICHVGGVLLGRIHRARSTWLELANPRDTERYFANETTHVKSCVCSHHITTGRVVAYLSSQHRPLPVTNERKCRERATVNTRKCEELGGWYTILHHLIARILLTNIWVAPGKCLTNCAVTAGVKQIVGGWLPSVLLCFFGRKQLWPPVSYRSFWILDQGFWIDWENLLTLTLRRLRLRYG